MRFTRFLAVSLLAPLLIVTAWSAPRHASSRPVARHPAPRKATTHPGTSHSNGHFVAAPGTRKHHKLL